jgi:hypothetical protein
MRASDLLIVQMDESHAMLRGRLRGLSDDEFWWEPVPDAWTVRRCADGRWAADYAEPDPIPAPFTTIGWKVVHVLECKLMYHEYAFGEARLRWDRDLSSPHTARDALTALDEHQARLRRSVRALPDGDLGRPVPTNWGEEWPAWRIVWTMIHHDLWHGGEIGQLRDLYARRSELATFKR